MKRNFNLLIRGFALYAAILFFVGCSQDEGIKPKDDQPIGTRGLTGPTGGSGPKYVYGLSDQNQLLLLKPGPPVQTVSTIALQGLARGEFMRAIDFRPYSGELYGVSDASMIYLIDVASGQVKPIGSPFVPGIKGATIGFDFDPALDQIRLVTDLDQNIRIDPNTGTVVGLDTDINPSYYDMNSIAYGYSSTTHTFPLYDIDAARGYLLKQNPQNSGSVTPVGPLNLVVVGEGGFDIVRSTNSTTGMAALYGHALFPSYTTGDNLGTDAFRLWDINLTSAKVTYRGKLPRNIIGLAIP